jgi:hypothetical protein
LYVGLAYGLHGMHAQHVQRQFCLAAARLEDPTNPIPAGVDAKKLHEVCGLTIVSRPTPVPARKESQ